MKRSTLLTVTSLFSILFLSLHFTSDFLYDAGELSMRMLFIAALILVVLLYGTLVLAERRSGHVIMLLGALAALAMPVLHLMTARGVAGVMDRPNAFVFVWVLLCLGVTGLFSFFLSVQGLVRLQRGQPR